MTEVSDGSSDAEKPPVVTSAGELSVGDVIVTDDGKRLRVDDVNTVKPGKHSAAKVVVRTTDVASGGQRELSYVAAEKVWIVGS
ncbi:hypothetical protein AB0M22_20985 [Nocardia sp. NPDC051756]|uniref:hypothetical protein n=1 Tax=Nocardia sp. NPDC051756 TaxID=3154751 RepID=UPI00342C9549